MSLVDKLSEEVYRFEVENLINKSEIKIYINPIIKRYLDEECQKYYFQELEKNTIETFQGVEIREGYEMDIIICSPKNYKAEKRVLRIYKSELKF